MQRIRLRMLSRFRRVWATSTSLGVCDLELPPELPAPVAGRVAHQESAERLADDRQTYQTEQERSVARQPDGCADEHESRDALRRVQREGGRPEAADRIGCDVGRRELERVEDVLEKCLRVLEQVDAAVVERLRQSVAGAVHGEHAPVPGER
jgi:hypothetical protein